MKPAELIQPLVSLKMTLGDDAASAMDAIIDVVTRFGDADLSDLTAKLSKLKPAARRASKSVAKKASPKKKAEGLTAEALDAFAERLAAVKDDPAATNAILAELRPAGVVTPAQLRHIAKSLGISSTSKTTKAVLFTSIEGAASQASRDRGTAQHIREGA